MKKTLFFAVFTTFFNLTSLLLAREVEPFHKVDFNTLPSAQKIEKPIIIEKPVIVEKPAPVETEIKEPEIKKIIAKKPIKKAKKIVVIKPKDQVQIVKEEPKEPIQEPQKKKPTPIPTPSPDTQPKQQPISQKEKPAKSNFVNKTEGSYLGIDFVNTKTTFQMESYYTDKTVYITEKNWSNAYGLGLNYKYAFNFNNFFFAPGVIFEQNLGKYKTNGAYTDDIAGAEERIQIKNRYGIKADLGYDVSSRFSPYGTIGYGGVSYQARNSQINLDNTITTEVVDASAKSLFYGAGFKINLTKNTSLGFEYNRQNFTAKTTLPEQTDGKYIDRSIFKVNLDIYKLGLSYRF